MLVRVEGGVRAHIIGIRRLAVAAAVVVEREQRDRSRARDGRDEPLEPFRRHEVEQRRGGDERRAGTAGVKIRRREVGLQVRHLDGSAVGGLEIRAAPARLGEQRRI